MNDVFVCPDCRRLFLEDRAGCCPAVYRGIINGGPLSEMSLNWRSRVEAWGLKIDELVLDSAWMIEKFAGSPIGKFLPLKENSRRNRPYERALAWSRLSAGVVVDFGCCVAHGSDVVKKLSLDSTYIGVDRDPLFLTIASTVYRPQYLYLSRSDEDRTRPLKGIASASVDLLIVSLLTVYENCTHDLGEWLRVLKPGGMLYYETHRLSRYGDDRSPADGGNVPAFAARREIAKWLARHFSARRTNCSLEEFVAGQSRMVGMFQRANYKPFQNPVVDESRPRKEGL
jgi:SAM-dependent methyltransferase